MKVGVIVFPGSNCDRDMYHVLTDVFKLNAEFFWHEKNLPQDIDAVVLTKLDVDAKGGAALSISSAIDKPIAFVGIGQEYEDIMPFDATWIVERIFS